jgi:hypothetical protein
MQWDRAWLQKVLQNRTAAASSYLNQLRRKAKNDEAYDGLFYEHLAKLWAYRHLEASEALKNEEEYLQELQSMSQNPPDMSGEKGPRNTTFDLSRFLMHYNACINELREGARERPHSWTRLRWPAVSAARR